VRRIILLLAIALVVVAMAVAGTGAAFAANKFTPPNKTNACQGPNDQPNCPSFR
jgi:hypothetical protein